MEASMAFVIVGVALIALHFAGIGPMAAWNWELTGDLWKFALPFGLAAVWWTFADMSGLTKRRAMRKDDARVAERRKRSVEHMGLTPNDRNTRKRR
jgi:small Trp-rich protein